MSQPCLSKPKGWLHSSGVPRELESTQWRGSWLVKSQGNTEIMTANKMIVAANQKAGRRRRRFHASPHMEEGAPSSGTASTAPRPVSSISET